MPRTLLVLVAVLVANCASAAVAPVPPPGGRFPTMPPGSALPSEAECARRVQRDPWEPRPGNAVPNGRVPPGPVPTRPWGGPQAERLRARVTGNFTGTTDEILQWASCKWGVDTEVTRAQAAQESRWDQRFRGDGGVSLGIMQVKATYWTGTAPWSLDSTAFNVDWSLGLWRACYEGYRYGEQARGDLWGCVGAHFSGMWRDPAATAYAGEVERRLAEREWLRWPSPGGGRPPDAGRRSG